MARRTSTTRVTTRELTRYERWYGRDEPPERIRRFSAGPLSFELIGVDLKAIRWGSVELLDRLYMSVRDQNWDTIGASISKLRVEQPPDGPLTITFRARNQAAAIDLDWQGTITASSAGTISYEMRGTARSGRSGRGRSPTWRSSSSSRAPTSCTTSTA